MRLGEAPPAAHNAAIEHAARWALRQRGLRSARFSRERDDMFVSFFQELRTAGVPVTLREYLTLMEAMARDLAGRRVENFYYLARAALVKDERNLDKFDRVFGHVFKGLEGAAALATDSRSPQRAEKRGLAPSLPSR